MEKIAEQLEQFSSDCRFIEDHRAELLEQYPSQWVAVFKGKVVAVAGTLKEIVRRAQESGTPTGRVALEFLDPDPKPLILSATQIKQAPQQALFYFFFSIKPALR